MIASSEKAALSTVTILTGLLQLLRIVMPVPAIELRWGLLGFVVLLVPVAYGSTPGGKLK